MLNDAMAARLRGAVYGQAVGDALGVPFEFKSRDSFQCTDMIGNGTHCKPAGTWSDDTAMMLGTLDSLADTNGVVNADDMRGKFLAWARNGEYTPDGDVFDIGNTTSIALGSGKGQTGERDNGNGSLMRIIPLAFVDCSDDDIRSASAVTHAHEISTSACVRFVHAARLLIAASDGWSAGASGENSGMIRARRTAAIDKAGEIAGLENLRATPRNQIRSGGFVLDTLRAAFWCLTTTDCYADCVRAAVNLGSDSDTTAAVSGALAGIVYGFDANPWTGELLGIDLLDRWIGKAISSLPDWQPESAQ
ncbi:ADP-ribosylglycohydrolase family protein [Bifidobacterium callimiconis]|uniref:ADP-ribosylglycohydrolase family protein n=1 Tax=Bifidobacterium callimiconis TaxID=2306973 RepID=UPI001F0A3A52|nr:ADP-ribosylglycohydrolase family protein [Bifidobacterium callimiconis]